MAIKQPALPTRSNPGRSAGRNNKQLTRENRHLAGTKKPMAKLIDYLDATAQAEGLADLVATQLRTALAAKARATLAVPGGTTPGPFLRSLSEFDLDWGRVDVMLTDERFVPETSHRSNTKLLRETLLQGPAAAARMVPFYLPADHPEEVLDQIASELAKVLPIDVCVLGMGTDMHIASLFPGADRLDDALREDCPDLILAMRASGVPEPRLSLTAPVLSGAAHLHLLISGPEKLASLKEAEQTAEVRLAPVRLALEAPVGLVIHYTGSTGAS